MRKPWILWILLAVLLLAACQGGGATPTSQQPETTAPGEDYPVDVPPGSPEEGYPMTTPPASAPGGSDPGLWSAYPPAEADSSLQRGNIFIDEAGLMAVEGQPGTAVLTVSGNLPTPCHNLRAQVNPPDANNIVAVEVYSVVDANMMCTQVLKPFSMEVARIGGLPAGNYSVTVNGEEVGKVDVP